MRQLTLGAVLLTLVANSFQIERLEDVLVYAVEPANKIQKREVTDSTKKKQSFSQFKEFVEDKLIQHTQALEHLVKLVQMNEETSRQLLENLSNNVEQPKLPEKIEVHQQRRPVNIEDEVDHPLLRLGKNVTKYGKLIGNILINELKNHTDPIPIIEKEILPLQVVSRRSFSSKPVLVPDAPNKKISPWCGVAILCHRTYSPVCGYDDNFGYGKFDDVCHMLQVNCYWKYNFALVPSCRPIM
ncbi:uncharacterized protein LOC106707707 isoform X2 [Papilio machaon]|uniref:uncharacterized protein LOC106707707 isoform X2 n=1 Tax=Papilio machaon TaxID=76193 RepID=UPI001E6653AB|nr:uncharacterized protein LOC106707707 isoform X2 [Papilio machaon]